MYVSTDTWACTNVQTGSFGLAPMSCQSLDVRNAIPGNIMANMGQFTVKNAGTISGAVYASVDPSTVYVTKNGKRVSSPMSKWISIYISDVNGKFYPIYVNGQATKPVLISGSKLLAKGKYIYPKVKYTFTDDGKSDQNTCQKETFNYKVRFDMKQLITK